MIKLNAIFHRKENNLKPKPCVVEKVISLTGPQYDCFAANMLRDYDFIVEDINLMWQDPKGVHHCLLVTGAERKDGILIRSEGASYARYSAHVPHVHDIIQARSDSPTLAQLGRKLSNFVDSLAAESIKMLEQSESASVDLAGEALRFGINMEGNETLWVTVTGMLGEKMEPYKLDMEINNGNLILTPCTQEMDMEM